MSTQPAINVEDIRPFPGVGLNSSIPSRKKSPRGVARVSTIVVVVVIVKKKWMKNIVS